MNELAMGSTCTEGCLMKWPRKSTTCASNCTDANARKRLTRPSKSLSRSKIMSTDLIPRESMTPNDLIAKAIEAGNLPIEQLERLMALSERWAAQQAKQQFAEAMQAAQEEMPAVERDKTNEQTQSKYARLESVNRIQTFGMKKLASRVTPAIIASWRRFAYTIMR